MSKYSPFSCYFLLLNPNILLGSLFSHTCHKFPYLKENAALDWSAM
jgi:hypothetical protein